MSIINIPIKELDFSFSRSSGAGGQNVNKLNTKVTLKWNIFKSRVLSEEMKNRFTEKYSNKINEEGVITITSQRFRNQGRNIADCIEKLQNMLEKIKSTPKKRKATRPTKTSIEKRLKHKKTRADVKKGRKKIDF